jgi:hypothetical protein
MAYEQIYAKELHIISLTSGTSNNIQNKYDWTAISRMIAGSTPRSCMFKFVSLRKFKLAFHKWEKEEEILLTEIIKYNSLKLVKLESKIGKILLKNYMKKV